MSKRKRSCDCIVCHECAQSFFAAVAEARDREALRIARQLERDLPHVTGGVYAIQSVWAKRLRAEVCARRAKRGGKRHA